MKYLAVRAFPLSIGGFYVFEAFPKSYISPVVATVFKSNFYTVPELGVKINFSASEVAVLLFQVKA